MFKWGRIAYISETWLAWRQWFDVANSGLMNIPTTIDRVWDGSMMETLAKMNTLRVALAELTACTVDIKCCSSRCQQRIGNISRVNCLLIHVFFCINLNWFYNTVDYSLYWWLQRVIWQIEKCSLVFSVYSKFMHVIDIHLCNIEHVSWYPTECILTDENNTHASHIQHTQQQNINKFDQSLPIRQHCKNDYKYFKH